MNRTDNHRTWGIVAHGTQNTIGFNAVPMFVSADTYTRYELLAPEAIIQNLLLRSDRNRQGATDHFNAIREGSEATDERSRSGHRNSL